MVYTKTYFIKVTTLHKINDDIIFMALSKNIHDSYIELYKGELLKKDIK